MPLDKDQESTAKRWMEDKGVSPRCSCCGEDRWELGEIISGAMYVEGGAALGGPNVPMLQYVCANCGCVRLFAAVHMGLVSGG